MAQSSTSSRPRRAPRIRYTNDDSDSDDAWQFEPSNRPARAARRVETYRESSDEATSLSSSSADESGPHFDPRPHPTQLRRSTRSRVEEQKQTSASSRKRKLKPAMRSTGPTSLGSFKRQKPHVPPRPQRSESKAFSDQASFSRNVPALPWQQLPYQVLLNIMQYASYPLYGPASRSNPSINWLCATSTMCRSFHEACIAALMYSPPLYPSWRAHGLIHLLTKDQSTLMTDYRRKVRYVDIEVKQLLFKKSGIAIDDLISLTPFLQGVRLYSNHDDLSTVIWAQPTAQRFNWSYPLELFDRLDQNALHLRSFEWNGRFPNTTDVLETAQLAHTRTSFSRLCELSCLNLSLPEKTPEVEIAKAQSLLAGALGALHELQRLSFRNCAMLDEVTVSSLPLELHHLQLVYCSQLTSRALEQYLSSGGTYLKSLTLDGNQSMSLGFMADLKTICPRLENLEVDMLYIDPTSFRDREPLYDELLPDGPPTWPSSLVSVSVENLRQLSASDAEDFFASLVDSSENLPHLKKLNIKAILKDASWRDRAELRKTWLPRLENVFLNTEQPANMVTKTSKSLPASQRQSTRIANSHLKSLSLTDNTDESDENQSRSVQARCDVVNLVISQERPAQEQFHEEDFLDTEPDDDGEWNERSQPQASNDYAW